MAGVGNNLAPTDGERTNNDDKRKQKQKQELINKGRKRPESAIPFVGCEGDGGGRGQAEIHGVTYTPLGQKYYQGDPNLSRGYRPPKNPGSLPLHKQRAGVATTVHTSSHRLRGWQTEGVSSLHPRSEDWRGRQQPSSSVFLLTSKVSCALCDSPGTPVAQELKRPCLPGS